MKLRIERNSVKLEIEDWYELHNGYILELNQGLTILVGPNGAGKSTLLHQIKEELEKEDAFIVHAYDNYSDGGRDLASKILHFGGSGENLAECFVSSEGQKIYLAIEHNAHNIGSLVRKAVSENKAIFLLWDAVDSGLSINLMREVKDFFKLIMETSSSIPIYIIFSANTYEAAKGEDCVDVRTGKHHRFKDYEEYANFICKYSMKRRINKKEKKN